MSDAKSKTPLLIGGIAAVVAVVVLVVAITVVAQPDHGAQPALSGQPVQDGQAASASSNCDYATAISGVQQVEKAYGTPAATPETIAQQVGMTPDQFHQFFTDVCRDAFVAQFAKNEANAVKADPKDKTSPTATCCGVTWTPAEGFRSRCRTRLEHGPGAARGHEPACRVTLSPQPKVRYRFSGTIAAVQVHGDDARLAALRLALLYLKYGSRGGVGG